MNLLLNSASCILLLCCPREHGAYIYLIIFAISYIISGIRISDTSLHVNNYTCIIMHERSSTQYEAIPITTVITPKKEKMDN